MSKKPDTIGGTTGFPSTAAMLMNIEAGGMSVVVMPIVQRNTHSLKSLKSIESNQKKSRR